MVFLVQTLTLTLLTLTLAAGCATERPFIWAAEVPPATNEPQPIIHPRDIVVVHVQDQVPLSGEFVIREDGAYLHPTLGIVAAQGRTTAQLAEEIQSRLSTLIVNARVTVSISRTAPIRVNVVGEVRTPGVYELGRDRSVTAALAAAGWITDFASADRIFVVRTGNREPRVRFRAKDLTAPDSSGGAPFRLRDGDVVAVE